MKRSAAAMADEVINAPLPVQPPPRLLAAELAPLLTEPFASAWQQPLPDTAQGLRGRLLHRLGATKAAEAGLHTTRRRPLLSVLLAPGVRAQTLYLAQPGQTLRPGEPLRVRLIELAPGARLDPALLGTAAELQRRRREWLLLSGSAQLGGEWLSQRDYAVTPAGQATPVWMSKAGATLFLRESEQAVQARDLPILVRDADAGWPDFAPGVQRRVLWQDKGQAAMLYHAEAGAQMPPHRHGHDEECLMVQGELFLDDLLLQPGDYQLAPAGSGHRVTETDTGVVLYAHGDLELQFVG